MLTLPALAWPGHLAAAARQAALPPALQPGATPRVAASHAPTDDSSPGDSSQPTDWEFLFATVRERLRSLAGRLLHPRDLRLLQADVLECVSALDKLQTMAGPELQRCRQLGIDLAVASAGTAQARHAPADTLGATIRANHLDGHDGLTQLANRRLFQQQMEQSIAARNAAPGGTRLALVYMDVDGIKPINGIHGRGIGDEALRIVAQRLARAVRGDDLVGRLGGDEFACLLSNAPGRRQLGLMADKLRQVVRAPLTIGSLQLAVDMRIGIAMAPLHGHTADALLTNAALALAHARRHHVGHAFADDAQAAGAPFGA